MDILVLLVESFVFLVDILIDNLAQHHHLQLQALQNQNQIHPLIIAVGMYFAFILVILSLLMEY